MKLSIILLSSENYEHLAIENIEKFLKKINDKIECEVILASSKENINLQKSYKFVYDEVFSNRLIKALNKVNNNFILLWLDDYLIKKINFTLLLKAFDLFEKFNIGACKLYPIEKPKIYIPGNPFFGIYDNKPLGRLNTQPTIYEKSFLNSIIASNESLWEFENNHSTRSIPQNKMVFGSLKKIIDYDEIIKGGKFFRKYKKLYPKITNIDSMTLREEFTIIFKSKLYRILIAIFGYNILIKMKKYFYGL